jgi:hypothetical protein
MIPPFPLRADARGRVTAADRLESGHVPQNVRYGPKLGGAGVA